MDCRHKAGNDNGWGRAFLKSRTPLCESRNDEHMGRGLQTGQRPGSGVSQAIPKTSK